MACLLALAGIACGDLRTGDAEVHGIVRFKMPAFPQTGSNKVQVFTEMHYQPSYKSQEGPRLMPPPESVAFGPLGSPDRILEAEMILQEPRYSAEEYPALSAPRTFVATYDQAAASELFRVNCVVCHGERMRGGGPIVPMMDKGPFPADLMGPISQSATDGELFSFIDRGGRQGFAAFARGTETTSPMPPFRFLLTERERWMLVQYLRETQAHHQ